MLKKTAMDPPLKLQRSLGKEKNVTKTKMSALKKDASALEMMKKTPMDPPLKLQWALGKEKNATKTKMLPLK